MKISGVIFEDATAWLKENLRDFEVDGISRVQRTGKWNFDGTTEFEDVEDGIIKEFKFSDFERALGQLCNLIDNKKLFVGGVTNSHDLVDPCNWDVEVVDAYFQLIFHGEVIYG